MVIEMCLFDDDVCGKGEVECNIVVDIYVSVFFFVLVFLS